MRLIDEIEARNDTLYRYIKQPHLYEDVLWLTGRIREYQVFIEELWEEIKQLRRMDTGNANKR
jgi:hypothetical protein